MLQLRCLRGSYVSFWRRALSELVELASSDGVTISVVSERAFAGVVMGDEADFCLCRRIELVGCFCLILEEQRGMRICIHFTIFCGL